MVAAPAGNISAYESFCQQDFRVGQLKNREVRVGDSFNFLLSDSDSIALFINHQELRTTLLG